jgi:Fic family protein
VPPYRIDLDLQTLLDDLRYWEQHGMIALAEQAARLHHRAVAIHPFMNGNGRWSRLLANIWLAQHDQPVIVWPEDVIGGASVVRSEYLEAIRSADAGDVLPLVRLQERYASPLSD